MISGGCRELVQQQYHETELCTKQGNGTIKEPTTSRLLGTIKDTSTPCPWYYAFLEGCLLLHQSALGMYRLKESFEHFKLLGVNLTWQALVDHVTARGKQRLYLLRILRRAGVPPSDIVATYRAIILPTLGYMLPGQAWHAGLTAQHAQSNLLATIQRRALDIAYTLSYPTSARGGWGRDSTTRRDVLCRPTYVGPFLGTC